MTDYPIDSRLYKAIECLFDDSQRGFRLLGSSSKDVDQKLAEERPSYSLSSNARARKLKEKLEGYIINIAAEVDELGTDELPRLQSEATGYLIALRELYFYIPEAFEGRY